MHPVGRKVVPPRQKVWTLQPAASRAFVATPRILTTSLWFSPNGEMADWSWCMRQSHSPWSRVCKAEKKIVGTRRSKCFQRQRATSLSTQWHPNQVMSSFTLVPSTHLHSCSVAEGKWFPTRPIAFGTRWSPASGPMNLCLLRKVPCVEVWEYTRGNDPRAPLVRYVPPGFLPTEPDEALNDQLVERRAQSLNPATLQWYFIGRLGPIRQECWDRLQSLKYFHKHELKKIPQGGAKGYPKVYTVEDWRNLGRNLKNVVFLNIHQACNRDQPVETRPLETVRVAQLLSLGFIVISEEVNNLDKELYKNIVLVEKNLFHEKKWSPSLVRLLHNKSALVEWQLAAYNRFKQEFRPSKLLHDARVWDGGVQMRSSCTQMTQM